MDFFHWVVEIELIFSGKLQRLNVKSDILLELKISKLDIFNFPVQFPDFDFQIEA